MKITILNGNPDPGNQEFDRYVAQLEQIAACQGHSIATITLRKLDLRGCIGCFGCWMKTPGECITPDDGPLVRRAVIQSDFTLLASPLRMGFPSAVLKTAVDKLLPLLHPYMAVARGEVHHRSRYERYPRVGLLLQKEAATDEGDLQIAADIFSRAALNLKSRLEFCRLTSQPVEDLARAIFTPPSPQDCVPLVDRLGPTSGQRVSPPARLTVFNGSPRGKKGNTPLMLSHFQRGFETNPGRSCTVYHLNRIHEAAVFQRAFADAECVWLGFPLYWDAMPGQVKAFLESLQPFVGRSNNPPIGFLVQSGFPEGLHLRHVERYLEKLAARLGSPYLGTLVRGGGEGTRDRPEGMNAKLFGSLFQLGKVFGETGQLDPALLGSLVTFERFRFFQQPVLQVLSMTPFAKLSWDNQMKANGVYLQRFAKPYSEPADLNLQENN